MISRRLSQEQIASIYDESTEKMPREQRQAWLEQRLAEQLRFAYENAPAARVKFDSAGVSPSDVRTVSDLERLPVTPKDELVRLQQADPPFGGFLAAPMGSLRRVYVSPGPLYDAFGEERVLAAARGFLRAGAPGRGDIVLVTMSYHMVPAGMFLTDALDLVGCTVVPAGVGQTELQIRLLQDLKATTVLGFPSFVMTLLKKAEEMGIDPCKDLHLKYVAAGGERHIQALKKVFEEDYGLRVVGDSYATADVGITAYDCGEGQGYHYQDEDRVVEIVDPQTGKQVAPGQVGEVVVTLFSKVYPLVRFGTGDLASYTDEVCPCGRTSPRITRILGMIGDHVRVKGMFVHLREMDEAMSRFAWVRRYQMVLWLEGHRDRITLKLETDPGVEHQRWSGAVNMACQDAFKLRMDSIEFLPPGSLPEGCRPFVDERWSQP